MGVQQEGERRPSPEPHNPEQQIGLVRDGDNVFSLWKQGDLYTMHMHHNGQFVSGWQHAVVFDATIHAAITATPPPALQEQEKEKVPEHLPTTLYGYLARDAVYRDSRHPEHKGEKEFFFPMSYRYDHSTWDLKLWFNIHVFGEHAESLYKARHQFTSGRVVGIEGRDYSYAKKITSRDKVTRTTVMREIHAHEVTALRGKQDIQVSLTKSDILDRDELLLGYRPEYPT